MLKIIFLFSKWESNLFSKKSYHMVVLVKFQINDVKKIGKHDKSVSITPIIFLLGQRCCSGNENESWNETNDPSGTRSCAIEITGVLLHILIF